MDITSAVVLTLFGGIVSGLVTTAIVVGLRIIWLKVVNPWVEEKLYQDAEIRGTWTGKFESFTGDDDDGDSVHELYQERIMVLEDQIQRLMHKRRRKRPKDSVEATLGSSTTPEEVARTNQAEAAVANSESNPAPQSQIPNNTANQSEPTEDDNVDESDEESTPEQESNEMMLELHRLSHTVTGRMVCIKGADQGRSYDLTGNFRNLLLTGTYQSFNRTNLDRGGFCLMLRHNGDVLDGFFACYSDGEHAVSPFQCLLRRQVNES